MRRFETTLLSIERISTDYRRLRFAWPAEAGAPSAGQFLTVRCSRGSDPLLRRPFAFSGYDASREEASFIMKVRGPATAILAGLEPGASLDMLGPLGRGFPTPPDGRPALCAGGGIGLGPVLFMAESTREAGREALLVLGFRTASLVPSIEFPAGTVICTDDGSAGLRGRVVDGLASLDPGPRGDVYACGPWPMLSSIAAWAKRAGLPCHAAMEQTMACGVGACMGCAIMMADGNYARACADGPVFDAALVDWSGRGEP